MRLSLKNFLINRAIRIVPALAVDICVSALLVGPLFTTLPLQEYFAAYEFKAYFANILGIIHFVLPGVFEANPFPDTVNGSRWTVPFEIGCYAIMSAYIGFGLLRRSWLGLGVALMLACLVVVAFTSGIDVAALVGNVAGGARAVTLVEHFVTERGLLL